MAGIHVFAALSSSEAELVESGAILLGSAAQSNSKVQAAAEKSGLVETVLRLVDQW
jgi:hypothetical protein